MLALSRDVSRMRAMGTCGGHWAHSPGHSLTLHATDPPPMKGITLTQSEGQQMNSPGITTHKTDTTPLEVLWKEGWLWKHSKLKRSWKMFLVSSWCRKGPNLVSYAGTDMRSGIIIITAININVWIPLLSTYLDDFIMGSLQVWLVSGFQNKIASSNLDFLDEMPLASSRDQFS